LSLLRRKKAVKKPKKANEILKFNGEDFQKSMGEQHNVQYATYHTNDFEPNRLDEFGIPKEASTFRKALETNSVAATRSICFASLPKQIYKGRKNRLVYYLTSEADEVPNPTLKKYLNYCVKYKLLPRYVLESDVKNHRYVIKLHEKLNNGMLYVYLSTIRFIQESPAFVKNIITLVDKYKMNFYFAWLVASKLNIRNSWHNFIPYNGRYGDGDGAEILSDANYKYNPKYAIALKEFVLNKGKSRPISCFDNASFKVCDTIQDMAGGTSNKHYYKTAVELLDERLNVLMDVETSADSFSEKIKSLKL